MKKRAGILIIFALLVALMLPTLFLRPAAEKASAETATDYSAYSSISNFVINTQEDFVSFATFYNAKATYNFSGKTVTLNCDIDLAAVNMVFNTFYGVFLGNGHKIYNQSKPLFLAVGAKNNLDAVISDIDFVNASNTVEYLLAESSYGTVSNISYWGNFTPVNISSNIVFRGVIKNNFGQMNGVNNFGKITAVRNARISGITESNYGVLNNCHFLGDINFTNYSDTNCQIALVAYYNHILNNTVSPAMPSLGQINDSGAVSNIVFTSVSTPANPIYIRFLFDNYGTVNRSFAIGYITDSSGAIINKAFLLTAREGSSVINSYYAYGNNYGVYDGSGIYLDFTNTWQEYLIEDYLGTEFFYYTGIYPVNKAYYSDSGDTAGSSVVLSKTADIYKLRIYNGAGTIYVKMTFDSNLRDMPEIKRLAANSVFIDYDGQYYAFYQSSKTYIFDGSYNISAKNLGCLATVTTVKIAQSYDDGANVFYDDDGFNYGYSGGTLYEILPSESLVGLGTKISPYLIGNANDLAALDGLTGYALLTNDIVVNSPLSSDNTVNLTDLNVTLFGGGHSIIGLLRPLTNNLNGYVQSVFLRGYIDNFEGGLVSVYNYGNIKNAVISATVSGITKGAMVTLENHFSISYVKTYGAVTADTSAGCVFDNFGQLSRVKNYADITAVNLSSGIVSKNNGAITLSENYGDADYGITANQDGTVANTVNMNLSGFADSIAGISTSINKTATHYALIDNNTSTIYQALDYLTMKSKVNYDMGNVFGYEIGTSLNYPVLREEGKKYKTEVVNPFRTYSFTNKIFNADTSYLIEDIELYVVTGSTTNSVFTWKYNGQSFFGDSLYNAGTYVMTVSYAGNDIYLPATKSQNFVINKATPPVTLQYESFSDLSAIYSGSFYVVSTPDPTNIAAIIGYGYTQSIVFTKGGLTIASDQIISVGTYLQRVVFSSVNYYDLTIERNINITRKALTLTIDNYTLNYLESINKNNITYSLQGLVSADSGKTLTNLVGENYSDSFVSEYTAGSNAGLYEIGFSISQTDNYTITVVKGRLTVNKIDLPQGSISFYNATKTVNGSYEAFYNGSVQELSAQNLPAGVSVTYLGNQNKDVGFYYPRATFSKQNYNDLELTVYFEIKKIPLTVTVSDKVVSFGYTVNNLGFEAVASGLVGTDTIASVFFERPFSYSVYDAETLKTSGETLASGEYTVKLAIGGTAVNNYTVTIEWGTLFVGKVYLTALYNNNALGQNTDFDNYNQVFDNTQITRAISYFSTNGIAVTINYSYYEGETLLENNFVIDTGTYTVVALVTPIGTTAENYIATTYQCTITITKQPIIIAMEQATYQFVYSAVNYGVEENFDYTGVLPLGSEVTFSCTKDGVATSAINAGDYVVKFTVAESRNYFGSIAQATLRILPKQVMASVANSYTYTGRAIVPTVTITGGIGEEITLNDFTFVYKNSANNVIVNITAAGSYTVTVGLANKPNYTLASEVFAVTVSPYNLYFALGELEFVYGTIGDFAYGGRNYTISATRITLKNYLITELNLTIDIAINFDSTVSGLFYVEESSIIKPANYNIYFTSESKTNSLNKITITKRPLNVVWRIDNVEYYNQSYEGSYTGLPQSLRWTYSLGNFAFSDNANNVDIFSQVLGDAAEILHVGNYTLVLTILNSLNYTLSNNAISIKIVRSELRIVVNNATIEEGESYVYPSLSVSGRRGKDTNLPIDLLDGANIRMVTDYTTTSPAGSIHNVTVNADFRNYYAVVTQIGRLSVVANPYPNYNLTDQIFVYNGQNRTVALENVSPQVNVVYSNNVHKNVGSYTVSAVITYPSGRVSVTTCTLTIIKATPTLELVPNRLIYTENRLLMPEDVIGTAKHSGANVAGNMQFDGEWYLREGEYNYYEVVFVPDDSQNYNTVNSYYSITSVQINLSALVFDSVLDITFTSDNAATITAAVEVSLKNVLEGLGLYLDGYKVNSIIINKSGEISFQIRYNGNIVFSASWEITYINPNDSNETVVNDNMLKFIGARKEADKINVGQSGGRISLLDEYKDKFILYVNGVRVDEYVLNGNEESIIIMIKSKTTGELTLFAKEYKIDTVVIEEPIIKRDYKQYFIIGGSVLGGVAAVVVVIFIIRKRKG